MIFTRYFISSDIIMGKKLFLFLLMFSSFLSFGQSGINTVEVNPHTALHIESSQDHQGVLIPRLTTAQRDAIVIDQQTEDGLTIFNTDHGCINFWNKTTGGWKGVCGELGFSEFTIIEPVKVFGLYKSQKEVDSSHFVQFTVQVSKPGSYELIATSSQDNGYSFLLQGDFPTSGVFNIQMPALGIPVQPTIAPDFDQFSISINGKLENGGAPAVTFEVEVIDSSKKPAFRILCGQAKVHGLYFFNVPTTNANYIEVSIEVDGPLNNVVGATYEFTSNTVDGLSFYGTGKITAAVTNVILYAEGTPTNARNKTITLKSNSQSSNAVCDVEVIMTIPKKKLLTIGASKDLFGYNFSGNALSNKLITTQSNYGTLSNSVVAFEGWEQIIDAGNDPSESSLSSWLTGSHPVDIVIIGFSWIMREGHAILLADYIRKGGVVLAFTQANTGSKWLLQHVFGQSNIGVANGGGPGGTYLFSTMEDPVLMGPFGNVQGKYWGEDASITNIAVGVNPSDIYAYSTQYNTQVSQAINNTYKKGVTAFRHRSLNFIWVGDGGFNSGLPGATSNIVTPFALKADNSPNVLNNYGSELIVSRRVPVYNAYFTANAIAWALRQTELNGINSGKF